MPLNITQAQEALTVSKMQETLIASPVLLSTLLRPAEGEEKAGIHQVHVPGSFPEPLAIDSAGEYSSDDTTVSYSTVDLTPQFSEGYPVKRSKTELNGLYRDGLRNSFFEKLGSDMASGMVRKMERVHLINMVAAVTDLLADGEATDDEYVFDASGGFALNDFLNVRKGIQRASLGTQGLEHYAYFMDDSHVLALDAFRDLDRSGQTDLLERGSVRDHYLGQRFGYSVLENYIDVTATQIFDAIAAFQGVTTNIVIQGDTYANAAALEAALDDLETDPQLTALDALRNGTLAVFYTNRSEIHTTSYDARFAQIAPEDPAQYYWKSAVAWGGKTLVPAEIRVAVLPASLS